MPPPPPREISDRYLWRLLLSDAWAQAALVFTLLGAIFTFTGIPLTIGIITAFVGIPFVGMGVLFLAAGIGIGVWRYKQSQQIVDVLKIGEAKVGKVLELNEMSNVEVNGHHPWTLRYQFEANGQAYESQLTTLNTPGDNLQPGSRVCVLYLPQAPDKNTIYPRP